MDFDALETLSTVKVSMEKAGFEKACFFNSQKYVYHVESAESDNRWRRQRNILAVKSGSESF